MLANAVITLMVASLFAEIMIARRERRTLVVMKWPRRILMVVAGFGFLLSIVMLVRTFL